MATPVRSFDRPQRVGGAQPRSAEGAGGAGEQAADEREQEAGERGSRPRAARRASRCRSPSGRGRPKPNAPRRRAVRGRASTPNAPTASAAERSRARRRAGRRATPCASDSPTTCRTTSRCVQPSALSVPSSRTRLPTEERVSSDREQERGDRGEDLERDAEPVREVRRVDERAADLVGDVLRARDLRVRIELLDLLLDGADRRAARGADEHRRSRAPSGPRASAAARAGCRRRRSGRRAAA